jgi:folate-dependent phosphoribosylglycinamide formyltransferase PurN
MKRIAIFSKTICPSTLSIIDHFEKEHFPISMVIIEKNIRIKLSPAEIKHKLAHDQFNRQFRKYSRGRRMARRLWDVFIPLKAKRFIEFHIASIPILKMVSVENFALKKQIDVRNVKKHSSAETRELLKEQNINYVLFGSSNWLLKSDVLGIEYCEIINVHPGKLPDYKGLDSLPWSIINEGNIGCTAFFINESLDGGDIIKFYGISLKQGDTLASLQRRISAKKPMILLEVVEGLLNNTLSPRKQDKEGMHCKPMSYDQLLKVEEKLHSMIPKNNQAIG